MGGHGGHDPPLVSEKNTGNSSKIRFSENSAASGILPFNWFGPLAADKRRRSPPPARHSIAIPFRDMYGLATADFFRRGRPPPADRIAPPPPQRQRLQDPPPLAPAPARHPAAAIDRDPETRLPINSFGPGERDAVRRAYIQRGVFVPPPTSADGKYPLVERSGSSERSVRVQAAWFQRFKWLELSASMDMLFCLPCYLFPPTGHLAKSAFVKDGFQSFKKVGGKDCALLRHEGSSPNSAHNVAVCKMTDLMNEDANIVTGMAGFNQANERERTENRTRLNGSIRALRYLMRQGLACRGHDESTESLNRGNFLELLNTLCERDEELARVSMGNAPQNATMTSPDIQKDIITFVRVGRPRRNALTDTNDHVFRVDLFYAAVDKMIAEIGLRFSPETTAMLRLASCISPRRQFEAFNVDQLVELVTTYYPNDFDSIDLRQLPNQLHNFHVELENDARLRDIKTLPALSVLLVQSGRAAAGYDLVYRLVGLILTLPVSSATAERIFSALRFIKNRLRTTMGQEFLNDAMLLYVEKELAATVTNDEIIVEFQKMKERRRRV